jgi:hypothetical protein
MKINAKKIISAKDLRDNEKLKKVPDLPGFYK